MKKEKIVAWLHFAGLRAIRTVAQAALATIGSSVAIGEVDWLLVASTSLLAGIVSLLMSVAGLPELKGGAEDGV
jgi:hypothetical protein